MSAGTENKENFRYAALEKVANIKGLTEIIVPVEFHTNKYLEELKKLANCCICLSTFNDGTRVPRVLHCGHTFCSSCVCNIIEHGNSIYVECPSCRTETKTTIGKISKNFAQLELLSKLNMLEKSDPQTTEASKQLEEQKENSRQSRIDREFNDAYKKLISHVKDSILTKLDNHKASDSELTSEQIQLAMDHLQDEIEYTIDNIDLHNFSLGDSISEDITDDEDDNSSLSIEEAREGNNISSRSIDYLSSDTVLSEPSLSVSVDLSSSTSSSSFVSATNE